MIEAEVTGWRGHRLFGLEPEFPNSSEDLRDRDPIVSTPADKLLCTETDHFYGLSIWLDRERLARQP